MQCSNAKAGLLMSELKEELPVWLQNVCICCAFAAMNRSGISCVRSIKDKIFVGPDEIALDSRGICLECKFFVPDRQRQQIIERTKEMLRRH